MTRTSHLPPISDEEEARIQAGIANDPDNPELTDEEIKALRPAREVLPPALYRALTRDRRERENGSAQEQVTLSLDRAVIEHFRAAGPEWPDRINEALQRVVAADREAAEMTSGA